MRADEGMLEMVHFARANLIIMCKMVLILI